MVVFRRVALLLATFLYFSSAALEAQDLTRTLKTDSKDKLDAVLVLDASGSMLLTDPLRLRDEGAKLFAQFLRSGDRLAIVQFSGATKIVRPLSAYDSTQVDKVTKTIQGVPTTGTFTDLLAPIKTAHQILAANKRKDADQAIILLSDGKMDPDPKVGSAALLTSEMLSLHLPELKNENVRVHTLSLSEQSDKALLAQIAEATNGVHWFTPTADDIHKSFAELFLVVKKPQIVPLTSKGFRIDDEVSEATFYINREKGKEVQLIPPGEEPITKGVDIPGVKWFEGKKFDVITIDEPTAGQWQVLGLPKNEGFATLLTNLKLLSNWPLSIKAGVPTVLEAQLFESKKPVVLPRIGPVVRFAFQVTPTDKVSEPVLRDFLVDDGTHGDKMANDGIYSKNITVENPGEYRLQLLATAPTFERHQQLLFRVKPRLLILEVIEPEESLLGRKAMSLNKEGTARKTAKNYFRINISQELVSARKLDVELLATDKEGNKFKLPLNKIDNLYEVPSFSLPSDGQWQLKAVFVAETKRKKILKGDSQVIDYLKLEQEASDEAVVQVVVADKEPEPVVEAKPMNWMLALLIVTVMNLLGGGGGFFVIKKQQGDSSGTEDEDSFSPHEPIETLIQQLQEKVEQTEVDLEDPIFTDDTIEIQILERADYTPAETTGDDEAAEEGEVAAPEEGGESEEGSGEDAAKEGDAPDEAEEEPEEE